MHQFVVLSAILSVAFAGYAPVVHHVAPVAQIKTIVEPHVSVVETPTIQHVGSVVKSIPTAHSYQSQTQYHSKSIVEPIYAHGVEKKIISQPIVKKVVEHVPVTKYVAAPIVHAPIVHHAPVYQKVIASPVHYSAPAAYAAPAVYAHAAPIHYAHSYHH